MGATQYQQDAIDACIAAFGTHDRYLVADEAGLGKTHVARGVIEAMWTAPNKSTPFNVYYIGSNLALLEDTINKLIGDSMNYNPITGVDRMSMFGLKVKSLNHDKINLFSCSANLLGGTESTTGKETERNLYTNIHERLSKQPQADGSIEQRFLSTYAPKTISAVSKARNILSEHSLSSTTRPALIIADEFHRYDNVLTKSLAPLIVAANKSTQPHIKLLLLSATPYNIYKKDWEDTTEESAIFEDEGKASGNAAFQNFEDVLGFLSGGVASQICTDYKSYTAGTEDINTALMSYVFRNERIDESAGKYCDLPTPADFLGSEFHSAMVLPKDDAIKRYRSLSTGICSFPERVHNKGAHYEGFPENADALSSEDFIFDTNGGLKEPMLEENLQLACIEKYNAKNGRQLLWVPPTAPLYQPSGVFANHRDYSKLLVFSAYKMIPRLVSGVFSAYAAQIDGPTLSLAVDGDISIVQQLSDTYELQFRPTSGYEEILSDIVENISSSPEDAEEVALYALASPQVCAYRILKKHDIIIKKSSVALGKRSCRYSKRSSQQVSNGRNWWIRHKMKLAKKIAKAFNSYFAKEGIRHALVQMDITTEKELLRYCAQGNLQAMMLEFAHCHGKGWVDAMCDALEFKSGTVHGYHKENYLKVGNAVEIPIHFAVPFSPDADDNGMSDTSKSGIKRLNATRDAFNSPFWPMIVTTTSKGQEGYDFDRYSHRIMHYSIPNSPTIFEQRDGRVDRRLSLLARKKMVELYGDNHKTASTFWKNLFAEPAAQGYSDLSPLWCVQNYTGNLKQQRIVPFFPYSAQHIAYKRLLNAKNKYRRAFGLPNEKIGANTTTPLKLNNINP